MSSRIYFIASGFIALFLMQTASAEQKSKEGDMLTVSYCQLIAEPEVYAGRQVRVEGVYVVAFEVAALEDEPSCHNSIKRMIGVRFNDSYQTRTDKNILKKFRNLLKVRNNNWGQMRRLKVTFVGTFNGEKEAIIYDNQTVTRSYDGIYKYQLVVNRIEDVQKLTHRP